MLEHSVQKALKNYLAAVASAGITVEQAVVFGSQTRGNAGEWE